MAEIRERAIAGIGQGDTFSVTRTFTEKDTHRFADITRDYNPVHFDKKFTKCKGYPKPISHGLLIGSMISEIGGQIGWLATGMSFRFRRPVYFGETITCELTITETGPGNRACAKASCFNEAAAVVLQATLEGLLPDEEEREVMRKMVDGGDPTNKAG